jgi:hypothetical protein
MLTRNKENDCWSPSANAVAGKLIGNARIDLLGPFDISVSASRVAGSPFRNSTAVER